MPSQYATVDFKNIQCQILHSNNNTGLIHDKQVKAHGTRKSQHTVQSRITQLKQTPTLLSSEVNMATQEVTMVFIICVVNRMFTTG